MVVGRNPWALSAADFCCLSPRPNCSCFWENSRAGTGCVAVSGPSLERDEVVMVSFGASRNCLPLAVAEGSHENSVMSLALGETPRGHRGFIFPPVLCPGCNTLQTLNGRWRE